MVAACFLSLLLDLPFRFLFGSNRTIKDKLKDLRLLFSQPVCILLASPGATSFTDGTRCGVVTLQPALPAVGEEAPVIDMSCQGEGQHSEQLPTEVK